METNGSTGSKNGAPQKIAQSRGNLLRQIFASDSPEKTVKLLPAQSLYLLARQTGLSSCVEVLEICSIQQLRTMLDFDLWDRDILSEERLWEWLELPEANEDLKILRRVIQAIDLKLVALLIDRYVRVVSMEEPADQAPGPYFYTPDRGYTWLHVTNEDSREHFLLQRLLAQIFEMDTELFYQLLNVPCLNTPSMLEFDSYEDRTKRLRSEGIPSEQEAFEYTNPMGSAALKEELQKPAPSVEIDPDLNPVLPLISSGRVAEPLKGVVEALGFDISRQAALSFLLNNVLVRFNVEIPDPESVKDYVSRALGAINIGLERIVEDEKISPAEAFSRLNFRHLFCHGFESLNQLRDRAKRVLKQKEITDPITLATLEAATELFPVTPLFMDQYEEQKTEGYATKLVAGNKPFEHLQEIAAIRQLFS